MPFCAYRKLRGRARWVSGMSHDNLAELLLISDVEHDSRLINTRVTIEAYLDLQGQRSEDNYKATPEAVAVHEGQ